jgi:hypothetical protein
MARVCMMIMRHVNVIFFHGNRTRASDGDRRITPIAMSCYEALYWLQPP